MPEHDLRLAVDAVLDAPQPAIPPAIHVGAKVNPAGHGDIGELVLPAADEDPSWTASGVEVVERGLRVVVVPAGDGVHRRLDPRGVRAPAHVLIEGNGVPDEGQWLQRSSRSCQTRAQRRSGSRASGGNSERRTIFGPQLASVHQPGRQPCGRKNPQYSLAVPCIGTMASSEGGCMDAAARAVLPL